MPDLRKTQTKHRPKHRILLRKTNANHGGDNMRCKQCFMPIDKYDQEEGICQNYNNKALTPNLDYLY